MEMTNWKTLFKKESYGATNFGIEIRVAIDRNLNENDRRASYKIEEAIEDAIMRESMRLSSDQILNRASERAEIIGLFGDRAIFVEEIPNGYDHSWYTEMSPWFKVTTSKGIITLGWRRRVISISWAPTVGKKADDEFPGENVTRIDNEIHAYGYGKAKQYIDHLLR